jgi:hypothetical protein
MPISDDTIRRWKEIEKKIQEFMDYFQCDRQEAMQRVSINGAVQAMETTQRIEKRQEEIRVSELKRRKNIAAKEAGDIEAMLK